MFMYLELFELDLHLIVKYLNMLVYIIRDNTGPVWAGTGLGGIFSEIVLFVFLFKLYIYYLQSTK